MTDSDPGTTGDPRDVDGHERLERTDGGTVAEPAAPGNGPSIDEDEVEPVEVLVGLAEDGEIDPWDIDVVRVTDKFLEHLEEVDLRTSGRALFYASVLLRMKSEAMLTDDEDQADDPPPDSAAGDPFAMAPGEPPSGPDPFTALEAEMDRRLERKRARGTPQTLEDLVRELRDAERNTWWKESREYDTSDSPRGFQRGTQQLDYHASDDLRAETEPTAADVTERTHGEDADELTESIADRLEDSFSAGREEVLFREISEAGGSRVETFLGLLFLSNDGRVLLRQDEFFGDLWIRDPAAPDPDTAAAAE